MIRQTQVLTTRLKQFFAAIALTMALPAMAQAACDTIQCTDQIGNPYVSNTPMPGFPNKAFVYVNIAHPSDMRNLDCTLQSNTYLTLPPNHPGYEQIFSLLQAYKLANKTIKIRVNTGAAGAGCSIAYVVATL